MAGGKGNPVKMPGGKPKAAAAAPKPVAPNITDKFGLMLLVLVTLFLIANLVVWGKVGADRHGLGVLGTGLFKKTSTEYDNQARQGKILSHAATGTIGLRAGEVDTVVINQGSADGVRVGDVFTPSSPSYNTAQIDFEFCVYHVTPGSCLAHIRTNASLDKANIDSLVAVDTNVSRTWAKQEVRKAVFGLGQ